MQVKQVLAMNEYLFEVDASRQRLLREQGALVVAFGMLKGFVEEMDAARDSAVDEPDPKLLVRAASMCLGACGDVRVVVHCGD